MDSAVARAMAKWPNVPAVFGWLALDRRGNWLIRSPGTAARFDRIANQALREFIARNYAADDAGRWYFQNGPQRVYVNLAYTPFVVHYEGEKLVDQCGRAFAPSAAYEDDEGSVLFAGAGTIALLDDRDLLRFADSAPTLQRIKVTEIAPRFGFVREPKPR
jgi:DUF2946 family protein